MSSVSQARKLLAARRYAYHKTFKNTLAEIVLHDLATFCCVYASPKFDSDRDVIMAEGRRQVWQRIAAHLHLTPEETWQFFDGRIDVPE